MTPAAAHTQRTQALSVSDRYEMPKGWYRPNGTPWRTVREQVDSLRAHGAYKRG